jgi:hypothetical protein
MERSFVLLGLSAQIIARVDALLFTGLSVDPELAAPAYNREFGLMENTQNVMLLFTAYTAFRLVISSGSR